MAYNTDASNRMAQFHATVEREFDALIRDVSNVAMAEADRMAVVNHINAARAAFSHALISTLPAPIAPIRPQPH